MDFALRLYALAQSNAAELELLQRQWPSCPRWPLFQRRLELGLERDLRPKLRTTRHSLEHCLQGLRAALHPRLQWVWTLLLLNSHGERAIAELVRLLADANQEVAEVSAWGLAQLGRAILPDLRERWAFASGPVKKRICQALWYLGEQARGCDRWLGQSNTDWWRAVLYRLKEHGWRPLLEARALPLWLNQQSLAALADLAFSHQLEDRLYAIRALLCWGPGLEARSHLLQTLACDHDPEIAMLSLKGLEQLGVQAGSDAIKHGMLSRHDEVRTLATHLLLESAGAGVRGTGYQPLVEHEDVQQWLLILCLRVWDTPWRIRALEFISQQGRCRPLMAARLQPFLEDADSQVRRAAVAAFVSLDGPLDMLEPLLRDPDDKVSGDVAERLLDRCCFGPILANLERKGVLSKVQSSFLLLQLLHEGGPEAITPYLAALSELGAGKDPGLQQLALKTLDKVDLDKVRWENWAQFNDCQRDTAVRLMQLHKRFPAELKEQILQRRVSDPLALQHFAEFAPEAALPFLKSGLQRLRKSLRAGLFGAVRQLGQPGWRLLIELLNEPQELALDIVGELTRWMNSAVSWDWLIEQGPAMLDGIQSEAVKNAMCAAVGQTFLGPARQVEQRKLPWALELAERTGSAVSALLYLQRAEGTIPEDLLDRAWLRALEHPQVGARMQTLAILRRIRKPCSVLLRQRPPDAEPEVRLRVLGLLHNEGGLEPREREELVALTRDGSLRIQAQSLLDRVIQEWKGWPRTVAYDFTQNAPAGPVDGGPGPGPAGQRLERDPTSSGSGHSANVRPVWGAGHGRGHRISRSGGLPEGLRGARGRQSGGGGPGYRLPTGLLLQAHDQHGPGHFGRAKENPLG